MAATIDIIGVGGSINTVVVGEASVRRFELMKEDYIRLVFSSANKINIRLGDRITHPDWGTFYITEAQKPTYNKETGGYDYDLRFNAPYYKWNNKLYKFEPNNNRNEASWSLTDNLQNHMAVFLRNLTHHGWSYTLDPNSLVIEEASRTVFIQFDNKYLLDALAQIADAFNVEWWITDNVIHLGKAESGTAVDFEVGVNVEEMSAESSERDAVTRIYAFGAAQNIPANYRRDAQQVLLNGVVQRRLMLPSNTPYIDIENGLSADEIVEGIVFFDDVYPKTRSLVSQVIEVEKAVEKSNSTIEATTDEDATPSTGETETVTVYRFKTGGFTFSADYILAGQNLQVQFVSGRLNGMTFDVAFNPEGEAEKKTVKDGSGTAEVINPDAQLFEIVRNDNYGLMLPNDTLKPAANDQFILLGWDAEKMSSWTGLIAEAEQELLQKATDYADKKKIDPLTYPCKMMADYMYGLNNGQQDPNYSKVGTFPLGQKIRLYNDVYFKTGSRVSRVIGYEYKLDIPYDGATIIVGESATYSRQRATEAAINAVTDTINYRENEYGAVGGSGNFYIITSNDTTAPSEGNVYSALRSDRQYARKNKNDIISSLWTFKNRRGMRSGLQTEDYGENGSNEDNIFGKGFELITKPDGNGGYRTRMEIDELFVRIKAFFAKLEIREISYVGGNYCFSAAGSKIYYVEWLDAYGHVVNKRTGSISNVATFRCYLYSDDGTTATINKWAVNDQAMCRTFNIDEGVHQNVSNKYYWRRVTGIGKGMIPSQIPNTPEYEDGDEILPTPEMPTEYQYVDISMSDCGTASDYPEAEDTIVQFGNWTDESRQGVIYLQVEGNNSPAIMEYSGVGANGQHFVIPDPTLLLSPKKNVIYGEFHSVVDEESSAEGDTIDDQLNALLDALNDIKNQADKKMEMWFGAYEPRPTLAHPNQSNYPASEWTTDQLKALHAQDLFYDTMKAPASNRGRAWRWIAADDGNGGVTYYWEDVTDQDTIDALEKIADVASDGKLTGGAEKTRVFLDWQKAVQEYLKYKEQASDYGITTELTAYITAFKALGKLLNAGNDLITSDSATTVNTPSWLADLTTETEIPSPTDYRTKWNNYYEALAALLKAITKKAKELADAAQADATSALNKIGDMANDGKLDPTEKVTVKREFMAAYHEMMDTDEAGYTSGILDMAKNAQGNYTISESTWITPYINAFKEIGKYLNGGTTWNVPSLTNFGDSTLPLWIQAANMSNTNDITGNTWRTLWSDFYAKRTAVLTALTDNAQDTADDAHDRIDDIVSDGIISAGSEKSLLYIDWMKAVAEYAKYIEQAADYFGANNTQDDALVTAYYNLAKMLNNGTNPTANILNGSTRPSWLTTANMDTDTVLANTPTSTPANYHAIWNAYQTALNALLKVITAKAKELADAAQADATSALGKLEDMASDGKLDPSEKLTVKREFKAAWDEKDKSEGIIDKCYDSNNTAIINYNSYIKPYIDAFVALGTYLNGGTSWTAGSAVQNDTYRNTDSNLPSWIQSANMSATNNITGSTWVSKWTDFYTKRTILLTRLSEDAREKADHAQGDASDALQELEDMANDDILTEFEKLTCLREWDAAKAETTSLIIAVANIPNITTAKTYLSNAFNILTNYLNNKSTNNTAAFTGTAPALLTATGNTAIDGSTFKTYWRNYYDARSSLLAAISNTNVSVFVQASRPTPPYKVGDFWVQTDNNNNIMVCVYGRTSGNGADSDWADLSDITEKRDPRILLASLCNMVYNYAGGYIRNKSSNTYLAVYLGSKPSSGHAEGDLSYYNGTVYLYPSSSAGWGSISNDALQASMDALYGVIGVYTVRIFRTKPSSPQLYDLVCMPVNFTDSNAPSGYQTVEGGICIQFYNGSSWEVLQESTHSIIENIKGYIRAVAYQRAGDYGTAAGFITTSDWARLFANATDADGNKIAEAHLSAFITKVSDGNGGYKIQSGVSIEADQINFKGKTVINNKFTVDSDGNVTMDGFTATNATITGQITATSGSITGTLTVGTYGSNVNSIRIIPSTTNPSIVGYVGTTEVFRIGTQIDYDGSTLPTVKVGRSFLRENGLFILDADGSNCRAFSTRFIVERVINSLHYPFTIDVGSNKKVVLKANGKEMWPTSKSDVGWGGVYVDGDVLKVNMDG